MEHESERNLLRSYLTGELVAVAAVDRWIVAAARPFQRKLVREWDDLLQDARLEVYRALERGEFRGEAQLRTYVWRVVSHSCLDCLRRAARWQWTLFDETGEEGVANSARVRRSEDPVETGELVARVLEQVPEDCRNLWRMIVAGLSYHEMSRETRVSEGALRVRVLRCRKRALEVRAHLLPERDRTRQ